MASIACCGVLTGVVTGVVIGGRAGTGAVSAETKLAAVAVKATKIVTLRKTEMFMPGLWPGKPRKRKPSRST